MVRLLVTQPRKHLPGLLGGVFFCLGDMACLWAALKAFSVDISLPALVLAYATGSVPAVDRFRGGAGIVEVLMTFALVSVGIPLAPRSRRCPAAPAGQLLVADRARARPAAPRRAASSRGRSVRRPHRRRAHDDVALGLHGREDRSMVAAIFEAQMEPRAGCTSCSADGPRASCGPRGASAALLSTARRASSLRYNATARPSRRTATGGGPARHGADAEVRRGAWMRLVDVLELECFTAAEGRPDGEGLPDPPPLCGDSYLNQRLSRFRRFEGRAAPAR